jgi:hypothetical protein
MSLYNIEIIAIFYEAEISLFYVSFLLIDLIKLKMPELSLKFLLITPAHCTCLKQTFTIRGKRFVNEDIKSCCNVRILPCLAAQAAYYVVPGICRPLIKHSNLPNAL